MPKLFTYLRYNADLTRDGLVALGLPHIDPHNVQELDSVDHIAELQEVGRAIAQQVNIDHFKSFPCSATTENTTDDLASFRIRLMCLRLVHPLFDKHTRRRPDLRFPGRAI